MPSGWNEENYELCGALCLKPEGRKTIAHGVSRREQMPGCRSPVQGRKIMPRTFTCLLVHVIFSTKDRAPDF
jgi:hypothetical protein